MSNLYGAENETISETLLDKLNDLTDVSCMNGDRIITRISIQKDLVASGKSNCSRTSAIELESDDFPRNGATLGISIVQGSDNKVYVKDLVKNGPGERHGIKVGDLVSTQAFRFK